MKTVMNIFITLSLAIGLETTAFAQGFPMLQATVLPAPEAIEDNDLHILKTVLGLQVFPDSEDPNQFYYVPPFRVYQFVEGATGFMPYISKIEALDQAEKNLTAYKSPESRTFNNDPIIMYQREQIDDEERTLEKLEGRVFDLQEKITDLQRELIREERENNESIVKILKEMIQDRTSQQNKEIGKQETCVNNIKGLKSKIEQRIASLTRSYAYEALNPVLVTLSSAGSTLDTSDFDDVDQLLAATKNEIQRLKKSDGGFMAMSLYSGFTGEELNALTYFKAKYMPHIKVSLLASNKLEFIALTEVQRGRDGADGVTMVHSTNGAGNYQNANFNINTTVEGAKTLMAHPGPFNFPIVVKAKVNRKLPAFEARLDCDFSNVYNVASDMDVKDGLVIFDNDITGSLKGNDSSDGFCHVELISGDPEAAEVAALNELATTYENLNIHRMVLSHQEANKHFGRIMDDIEGNRRNRDDNDEGSWFNFSGIGQVASYAFGSINGFHWHTNRQNLERISNMKFSRVISIAGNKEIDQILSARICLYYSAINKAYNRCSEQQQENADRASVAFTKAMNSSACAEGDSSIECGQKRDRYAPELLAPVPTIAKDNNLPSNI